MALEKKYREPLPEVLRLFSIIVSNGPRTMAVKIRKKILLLKTLVQFISEGSPMWKELIPQCERRDISKAISQVLNLYGKQVMHKTLNERQKVMMEKFNQIDRALNFTNLVGKTCGKGMSFWEFLTDDKNQAEIMEPSEYNFQILVLFKENRFELCV